jgi:ribosomal protein S18 acetylase RimI-like enzyme
VRQVIERFDGRAAVLERVGETPYTRLMSSASGTVGFALPGAVAWVSDGPWGPVTCLLGTVARAADLLVALHGDGLHGAALRAAGLDADDGDAGPGAWTHLPLMPAAGVAPLQVRHRDDWEFRWLVGEPPHTLPAERLVRRLGPADHAEIDALLDAGNPASSSRPGQPRIRAWYGIRAADTGRLVACGADRSRNGVGFLAGITVDPAHRGQGLGPAVTAAMTRHLHAELGAVALGVTIDNTRAIGLYERLGFTETLTRTSFAVLPARIDAGREPR